MDRPLNSILIGPEDSKRMFGVHATHYQLCKGDGLPLVGGVIPARFDAHPSEGPGISREPGEPGEPADPIYYGWQRVESRRQRRVRRSLREQRGDDDE